MTITAQTADGVQHQFPDGTQQPVIDKAMHDYTAQQAPKPVAPAPNSTWDAVRSLPGGLAKGIAGTLGLPGDVREALGNGAQDVADYLFPQQKTVGGMVAKSVGAQQSHPVKDAVNNIIGSLPLVGQGLQNAPTSTDLNKVFSAPTGGYYQPKTTAGQYAQTIASFVPAAFGGEASIPARLARVVIPGATSETAGQLTAGTDYEPAARVAGALLGGGVAAARTPVIRSINKLTSLASGGPGFLDPSVEAAATVKKAFAAGGGVNDAAPKLQAAINAGGPSQSLADLSNPVRRLVAASAMAGGRNGQAENLAMAYADKVRANLQPNVVNRTMQLASQYPQTADETLSALQDAQTKTANADYAKVGSTPVQVQPAGIAALRGNPGQQAIKEAMKDAEANGDYQTMHELQSLQTADLDHLPTVSARTLDAVQRSMGDIGNDLSDKFAYRAKGFFQRGSNIDASLAGVPELAPARQNFGNYANLQKAIKIGQQARTLPAESYSSKILDLSGTDNPAINVAAGIGHRQAIIDAVQHPSAGQTGVLNSISSMDSTKNLATSFGAPAAESYQQAIAQNIAKLKVANSVLPGAGSKTAGALMDQSMVQMPTIPRGSVGRLKAIWDVIKEGSQLTPEEHTEIVRLGLSEADLRAMAAKGGVPPALRGLVPVALAAQQGTHK